MLRLAGAKEEEVLKKQIEYADKRLDELMASGEIDGVEWEKAYNHKLELQERYNNLSKQKNKELIKDVIDGLNEIAQATLKAYESMIQGEIDANRTRIDNQQKIVDTQKVLAEQGLDNTLAIEQKRQDDLFKQELAAKRKLQKIKELEIFLNALAGFADENPKTALAKALGLLAATKAAEAIFAEEGAIVGTHETNFRGQRHRSGRDRIAVVEEGEGIIPAHKMIELGLNTKERFNNFIRTPFNEKLIPSRSARMEINMSGVINELQELKDVVRNMPVPHYDMEGVHLRLSKVENGLKLVTIFKKPSI
jgi:hypothetical protein